MANRIKYLGHAAFSILTGAGKTIYIDPFISQNPTAAVSLDQLKACDIVLITHDHFDHMGDSAEILKKCGGVAVGMPETVAKLKEAGVSDANILNFGYGMNTGGTCVVNSVSITMTQAFHSGTSNPNGYVVKLEDGKTIYHSGDTGIFGSMEVLGEIYKIDLAMLPIGSVFTMDPLQAAVAARMLKCKKVIPMHYKTFPFLVPDPSSFVQLLKEKAPGAEAVPLNPGQECEL